MRTKTALLDVNVLVALFHARHIYHQAAHEWLKEGIPLSVCPTVINGCVRVLAAMPGYHMPVTVSEVANRVHASITKLGLAFWEERINILESGIFDLQKVAGPRQITDVYLLGLAVANDGVFATFDQAIPWRAVRNATAHSVLVIPN
jgi:predicted nucleic acid-binding protein